MDMQDRQFDNWMKASLHTEIALSKQNKQRAWEQIQLKASQPASSAVFAEEECTHITAPLAVGERLETRIWQWVAHFVTQENTFHKAHAHSTHFSKASHAYTGGLTLHGLELMRHRWTCAV